MCPIKLPIATGRIISIISGANGLIPRKGRVQALRGVTVRSFPAGTK
jgi:hypothetical protein